MVEDDGNNLSSIESQFRVNTNVEDNSSEKWSDISDTERMKNRIPERKLLHYFNI